MNRRLLVIALWFYAGWALGSFVAAAFGMDGIIGPLSGALAAFLVAWNARKSGASARG